MSTRGLDKDNATPRKVKTAHWGNWGIPQEPVAHLPRRQMVERLRNANTTSNVSFPKWPSFQNQEHSVFGYLVLANELTAFSFRAFRKSLTLR